LGAATALLLVASCTASSDSGSPAPQASGGADTSCIPPKPSALPSSDTDLQQLTGAAKAALEGYPDGAVNASPWADFKPTKSPPWIIGYAGNQANPANDSAWAGLNTVISQNASLFGKPIRVTANPSNDAASQIQGMRTLLQQGVDLIISPLASPTALNGVIDEAAAKNVPVISFLGRSTSKNAINLQVNAAQVGYLAAAELVKQMNGSKDVLMFHGVVGLSIDKQIYNAAEAVFKACKMNLFGPLTGNFDPATAKTETLKFLSTHPGQIGGVFQVSSMAIGIIDAFKQTGRAVPPVTDIGALAPSMAYWRDNRSTYRGLGVGLPVEPTGRYSMSVALAMLQGKGLKVTDTPYSPVLITNQNLDQWVRKDWTTTSTNISSDGPPDVIPIPELLKRYFAST